MRKTVSAIEFTSEFADRPKLLSVNRRYLSPLPPNRARVESISFPQIRNAHRLFEIHQARLALFAANATKLQPRTEDPAEFLRQSVRDYTATLPECGCYYLDRTSGIYRPTWKGAILMSWKNQWWARPIRTLLARQQAARLLRELGIA